MICGPLACSCFHPLITPSVGVYDHVGHYCLDTKQTFACHPPCPTLTQCVCVCVFAFIIIKTFEYFNRNILLVNEHSVIIYSLSCHSKHKYLYFFCGAQKKIFSRMSKLLFYHMQWKWMETRNNCDHHSLSLLENLGNYSKYLLLCYKEKRKSHAFVKKVNDEQVTNLYFKKNLAHLSISSAKLSI